ncbi:ATP-binding protein [Nocardioides zeae]
MLQRHRRARRGAPEQRRLTVTTRDEGGSGLLTVDDAGPGLTRDPFEESFTSKEHGSGIGLALSHRIVTRQHGTIWAERSPDGARASPCGCHGRRRAGTVPTKEIPTGGPGNQ